MYNMIYIWLYKYMFIVYETKLYKDDPNRDNILDLIIILSNGKFILNKIDD